MITEDYVSFEVAKLLEEKGFYGECSSMYLTPKPHCGMGNPNEPKIAPHGRDSHYYEGYLYQCEAPTLQMAMKWLRNKGIYIQIRRSINTYLYGAIMLKDGSDTYATIPSELETYEEAVEAALKYTLKNLI